MNHEKHERTQKKKATTEQTEVKPLMDTDGHKLVRDIREIISQTRSLTRRSVNSLQVISNYLIGMRIVLEEQGGHKRAEYGKETMKLLAEELTQEFGRGYSRRNIELMRKFYLTYSSMVEQKTQTVSALFDNPRIGQTVSDQSSLEKSRTLSRKFNLAQITQTLSAQLPLSWSHYLFLMGISNLDERKFYEIESANEVWSLRELKRQFNSSLFERLALSRDKEGVKKLSEQGQLVEKHSDVIKDPLVLEFLIILNDVVKVVVSILEHTTQQGAIEEKTKAPRMMRNEFRMITNQFSCISCLSWLKKIRVHLCSFVVPNGGAQ